MTKEAYDGMTFGKRLAYTRHKKGLTQKQLAELIGVKCHRLSDWEEGIHEPDVSMIQKIIEALEVPENWFENDDNFSMKNMAENPKYIQLTERQQQLVAKNEKVIGAAFQRFVREYHATWLSYDDFYGDAAIGLCKAAKIFDETYHNKGSFFSFAFVSVKWYMLNSYRKKEKYLHRTTSLNKIIGQDDHGTDIELAAIIPSPDKWEQLEYKILVESVFQKVESVLGAKEKEAFRLWLLGNENSKIEKAFGISKYALRRRLGRAKKKCRAAFNPDEIFA